MLKVFDFVCSAGHRHEMFVPGDAEEVRCPACGAAASKAVSLPRFRLEGITGSFPTAWLRWEKKRAEKQAVEERKLRDHGDDGWT